MTYFAVLSLTTISFWPLGKSLDCIVNYIVSTLMISRITSSYKILYLITKTVHDLQSNKVIIWHVAAIIFMTNICFCSFSWTHVVSVNLKQHISYSTKISFIINNNHEWRTGWTPESFDKLSTHTQPLGVCL